MEELIRNVIFKYTNVKVQNNEENLLDLPIVEEVWLYIIIELSDVYHLSIVEIIEKMRSEEFTIKELSKKIESLAEDVNE